MENKILELNKINLTPDIENNIVELDNNFSFEKSLEKIKESYENKFNSEEYMEIDDSFFRNMLLFFFYFFSLFSIFISPVLLFFLDLDDEGCNKYFTITMLIFFSWIVCYFFHLIFFGKSTIKNEGKKLLNNVNYYLPLSKDELFIILNNNKKLREYVKDNKSIMYSQYTIEKILNDNSDELLLKNGEALTPKFLDVSDVDFNMIKKSILEEQNKVFDMEFSNNKKSNTYQVTYSIENGPKKQILLKNVDNNKKTFLKYIESLVEKNYDRKCDIVSIDLML